MDRREFDKAWERNEDFKLNEYLDSLDDEEVEEE